MLNNDFLAESANIKELVPEAEGLNILRSRHDGRCISHTHIAEIAAEMITRYSPCTHARSYRRSVNRCMSNSFGFGGTNACLIFDRFSD